MKLDPLALCLEFSILAAAATASHAVTTIYLMRVLGNAFDRDWTPRMLFPISGFRQRYVQTVYYAGAVLFRRIRRTIFEDIPYDFRRRVSRTTVAICLFQYLVAAVTLIALAVVSLYIALELWHVWQHLPRVVPTRFVPETPDLAPL